VSVGTAGTVASLIRELLIDEIFEKNKGAFRSIQDPDRARRARGPGG